MLPGMEVTSFYVMTRRIEESSLCFISIIHFKMAVSGGYILDLLLSVLWVTLACYELQLFITERVNLNVDTLISCHTYGTTMQNSVFCSLDGRLMGCEE